MASVRIELELPEELAGAIGGPQEELPQRVRELLAIELSREGALAIQRAAQAVGLAPDDFIALLTQRGGIVPEPERAAELCEAEAAEERLVRQQGHGAHTVTDISPAELVEAGRIFRARRGRQRTAPPTQKPQPEAGDTRTA